MREPIEDSVSAMVIPEGSHRVYAVCEIPDPGENNDARHVGAAALS